MNNDDSFRNPQYTGNRKTNNKGPGYSPSANYNYNLGQNPHGNHNGNHGNHNSNNHGNHGNGNYGNQQQRRKNTNFKPRDNHHGQSDRIIKQNDIIIRLLKEIRDRLPAPPEGTVPAPVPEKNDTYKSRKYTGKQTQHKQEEAELEPDGNEAAVNEETESVESVETAQPETVPAQNDDEALDSSVNGNQK